jgi:hypothetical protein
MFRDCLGAVDYINHSLCKRDLMMHQIVLPDNTWILYWMAGNNIKE